MGLYNFPSALEGFLPTLVMNTLFSVTLSKNFFKLMLQKMKIFWVFSNFNEDPSNEIKYPDEKTKKRRRISITQFKSVTLHAGTTTGTTTYGGLHGGSGGGCGGAWECSVCLCKFKEEEMISELSCKHFFHSGCLEKWFDNLHSTCPLCRSVD